MADYINLFEQSIDEAYIGKTDTLLEIEKQFALMQQNLKMSQDLSSRPEVQRLNRLVEKQFGMEIFSLKIEPKDVINAYTSVIGTKFDIALEENMSNLVVGSPDTGYRFKPNNHLCLVTTIYLGLIKNEKMTPEGLTAILLHEIGHNFADCLDNKIKIENKKLTRTYYNYLIWKASVIFGRRYKKELKTNTNKHETEVAKKEQKSSKLRGWIRGLSGLKYNFAAFCGDVLNRLACAGYKANKITKNEEKRQEERNKKSIDRRNEVFADKFAAVYGYAIALPKALYSMDTTQSKGAKFIDKVFSPSINDNFEDLIKNYYLYDPHPHTIQRANAVLNTLKAEVEKEDLDPKVKAMLKDQINQIEQFVKEITTATKNDSEREATRKAFYKTVAENSPDALAEELEKEIEKELDEGLKKNSSTAS